MRTQITQADIIIEALKMGAGTTAALRWRTHGIPNSWRWRLKDHFSPSQLDNFINLPERKTP